MTRVGEILKKFREERGLSLAKAAEGFGTVKGYLCAIESGKLPPPSRKMALRMARFYRVSEKALLALVTLEKLPPELDLEMFHQLVGEKLAGGLGAGEAAVLMRRMRTA